MAYHVYVHDLGAVDFLDTYDTKAEASAAVHRIRRDASDHPTQWNLVCPSFEITTKPR
jgi:hypothetical protein